MRMNLAKHLFAALTCVVFTAELKAQTSAFTYQGFLMDGGVPVSGEMDFQFLLHRDELLFNLVGMVSVEDVPVSNGTFVVKLDFGAAAYDGDERWLEIGVRPGASTNDHSMLAPRQELTSAPHAIKAANAMTVVMGTISNPTFIGTTTMTPFDVSVNGQRAFRLEDNGDSAFDRDVDPDGAPNLIGGASVNTVGAGVVGATISGGGANDFIGFPAPNTVLSDYSTVGGGFFNSIAGDSALSTIAGGSANEILAGALFSTIGGGVGNQIFTGAESATIAGGEYNSILSNAVSSAIVGGYDNQIQAGGLYGFIGGGTSNRIGVSSEFAAVVGGSQNSILDNSDHAIIAGGTRNDIGSGCNASFIGGGERNSILGGSIDSAVAGGTFNDISAGSFYSVIGGGFDNNIGANSPYATVAGGRNNDVGAGASYAFAAGRQAKANHQGAFVWGDSQNADFASTANDQFLIRAAGGVGIGTSNPDGATLRVEGGAATGEIWLSPSSSGGNADIFLSETVSGVETAALVTIGRGSTSGMSIANNLTVGGDVTAGAFNTSSDRNAKENLLAIDTQDVLEKVVAMPIRQWNFKNDSARHVGPMAQDFHAAFGLGTDERHIATVDADGVALAAIQGLNQKLEEARADNAELRKELLEIKHLLSSMTKKGNQP